MSLLRLFFAFFQIGLFSIGGGYAIIPMISEQVVQSQHWLSAQEFTDIITISQMTPGPLAVNTSTFVGMRVAGIPGALCATIGCICMGVCIAYGIYHIFQRFSDYGSSGNHCVVSFFQRGKDCYGGHPNTSRLYLFDYFIH